MSKKSRLIIGGFLLSLILSICGGCSINPVTGEERLMLIPEYQDVEIGQAYAPEIEKQLKGRIENEGLQTYIDTIGQRMARVSHRPDFDYHFTAVNEETINAIALPGGYIFVTRGMLEKLTSEAQLASVLAHEVTHVAARHVAATISREIPIDILLAAVTPDEVSQGLLMMRDISRQILSMQFSRKDEREADLGGLDYMVAAGYNPNGMVETMQILQQEDQERPVEFFSTHPSPQNRVAYLGQRIETKYYDLEDLKDGKRDYRRQVLEQLEE